MKLTFIDSQERYYADLDGQSLYAEPGQEYELSSDPGDGRWSGGAAPVVTSLSPESAPSVSPETPLDGDSEPSEVTGA